jgi:hypothetical protein
MKNDKFRVPRITRPSADESVGVGQWKAIDFSASGRGRPRAADAGSHSNEETDMETAMPVAERGRGQREEGHPGRPNQNGRLLKPLDAAKYLGICTRQVQYLTKKGELTCIYIGTSPRYAVPDIEAFIDRCRRKGGRG